MVEKSTVLSFLSNLKLDENPAGRMERVYGQIVDTTVGMMVQKLGSLLTEEIGNINADLENLNQSLLKIRSILEDAERKQLTDESVQIWLMKLEAVAFDADYVFDQIKYCRLGSEIDEKVSLRSAQLSNFHSVEFRCQIAQEIMEIEKRIKSINEEAKGLGLLKRKRMPPRGDGIGTVFIGREYDVAKLVNLVRNPTVEVSEMGGLGKTAMDRNTTEEKVFVLPIVGMGGLGKTTLARKVYDHADIISLFEKRIWVHLSKNSFDPVDVFKSIFASSTGKNVDGSRQFVLQKLQRSLGNKKYLLVLDDVWNEDNYRWENFMSSLKGISSSKGNVILLTTRNRNVANIVKTFDIHELGPLSEQDSWLLIKAKAFGGEDVPTMSETVGKNIAKWCLGLPLAAHVVGTMLRGKSEHECISMVINWISSSRGNVNMIPKVLKLGFDHLVSPLFNKCLALFSIIPKGWLLEKNVLVKLWMAEGLLQTDEEKTMELAGNEVFSILQQSSLLQLVKESSVEYCGMHDLVYDLASTTLNSTYLHGAHQSPYMCALLTDEPSEEQAKCLRALSFAGKLSHEMCSNLTRLHVLILDGDKIEELPNEIGELISLRFLGIHSTGIKCLPDSIGELYLLETLMTPNYLERLPHTIRFTISLRHLHIPNIKLPPKIGRLTSLQTLPYFQVGDEEGCGISELGSLKNLKGDIEILKLEKVCNKEDAKSADLFHKPNLLKLKLVWSESRADYEKNDEDVLEGLRPHWNLESLKIIGFKGIKFPLWTSRMEVREDFEDPWIGLDKLVEIELSDCVECDEIPIMGQLPRLKSLVLRHLSNLKSMSSSFYSIEENDVNNVRIVLFPALEKLELINMENLATWEDVPDEVNVFPRLEYLKIEDCRQMKSSPSHFPCLKELKIENMESCTPLMNIVHSKLISLRRLKIHSVDGLGRLTDELFHKNRDLVELEIYRCKNLSEMMLPCLGGGGASLRKMKIAKCRNLKSVAYPSGTKLSSQGFTSLRHMEFLRCSRLTDLPCEMVESCALSIETLWLSGLQSLTNLPQLMSIVRNMPRLTSLGIECVPKLPEVVMEIGSLHSLQELSIGGYSDCLEYDFVNVILDLIFPVLQSLCILTLRGMDEWDAIPGQLQYLTTLDSLTLSRFGIEAVPEWLERLSSLRILKLCSCKKLRQLPSKKAMQGLTTLKITACPVLKKILEEEEEEVSNESSERFKVSDIPDIEVDGLPFSPHSH